jgi:hypothetical protein
MRMSMSFNSVVLVVVAALAAVYSEPWFAWPDSNLVGGAIKTCNVNMVSPLTCDDISGPCCPGCHTLLVNVGNCLPIWIECPPIGCDCKLPLCKCFNPQKHVPWNSKCIPPFPIY